MATCQTAQTSRAGSVTAAAPASAGVGLRNSARWLRRTVSWPPRIANRPHVTARCRRRARGGGHRRSHRDDGPARRSRRDATRDGSHPPQRREPRRRLRRCRRAQGGQRHRGSHGRRRLLNDVAHSIMHYLRSYDVICRFGGDEFVCSLAGQNADGARERFEQIPARLCETRARRRSASGSLNRARKTPSRAWSAGPTRRWSELAATGRHDALEGRGERSVVANGPAGSPPPPLPTLTARGAERPRRGSGERRQPDTLPRHAARPGCFVVVLSAALAGAYGCGTGQEGVSIFPAPGTRTASPGTQISVRGAGFEGLKEPRVTGSSSGVHRGRWSEHPDHRGTSFMPEAPFHAGERVTVRLGRSVNGAGGEEVRFSIAGVARAGPGPPAQPAKGPLRNIQAFRSRPDLRPPAVEREHAGRRAAARAPCSSRPRSARVSGAR